MKSLIFNFISVIILFKAVASQAATPNDCQILADLYREWNRPDLITWNNVDGSCCDKEYQNIACDPHQGVYRIAELKLRSKGFSGILSDKVTQLKYLNYLTLADNNISGSIPQNIGDLLYLTKFSLRNNSFNGGIPESIGKLDGLFHMDLSSNNLNGNIPESFGNLKQMQYLSLADNALQGYIPESIKGLKKLTTFHLGNNKGLTGYVPLIETASNCTYVNTNICYLEGALCQSTAHPCSESEINDTRKNNGYDNYKEDNEGNSNSNSSSDCKCDSKNDKKGGFLGLSPWILIAIGVAVIAAIVFIVAVPTSSSKTDKEKQKQE